MSNGNREYKNDASFILNAQLSIYEHQSTVCPNMPVRNLIYFTHILERILNNKHLYGQSIIKFPTPRFAVFYNGSQDQPEINTLKLSDAFESKLDSPELELECIVYNIYKGKNKELLDNCPFLKEYMIFVDYVRDFHAENGYNDLKDAINRAIDLCIEENVLKEFLIHNRSEVEKVMELDFTFERQLMLEREQSLEEGKEEVYTIISKLNSGVTKEELKADGYDASTVETVFNLLNNHSTN